MPTWPDTPSIAVRAAEGGSASRPPGRWFPRPFTIRRSSRDTVTATPSAPSTRADTKAPAPLKPRRRCPPPDGLSRAWRSCHEILPLSLRESNQLRRGGRSEAQVAAAIAERAGGGLLRFDGAGFRLQSGG